MDLQPLSFYEKQSFWSGWSFLVSLVSLGFFSAMVHFTRNSSDAFASSIYGDRIKRSSVFVLILSIIMTLSGISRMIKNRNETGSLLGAEARADGPFLGYMMFMSLISTGLLADMINSINNLPEEAAMENQGNMKLAIIVFLVISIINVLVAALLIYGPKKALESARSGYDRFKGLFAKKEPMMNPNQEQLADALGQAFLMY